MPKPSGSATIMAIDAGQQRGQEQGKDAELADLRLPRGRGEELDQADFGSRKNTSASSNSTKTMPSVVKIETAAQKNRNPGSGLRRDGVAGAAKRPPLPPTSLLTRRLAPMHQLTLTLASMSLQSKRPDPVRMCVSISSRTRRKAASCSSSVPVARAGSSNGQCSRVARRERPGSAPQRCCTR